MLKELIEDFKQAKSKRQSTIEGKWAEWDKIYTGDTGRAAKDRSNIKMLEVKKKMEQIVPQILNSFLATNRPITLDSSNNNQKEMIIEQMLNAIFTTDSNRKVLLETAIKKMQKEGTAWLHAYWSEKKFIRDRETIIFNSKEELLTSNIIPDEEVVLKDGRIKVKAKEEVIVENRPRFDVLDNEDVYPDAECSNYKDMNYVFIRKRRLYKDLIEEGISEEELDKELAMRDSNSSDKIISEGVDDTRKRSRKNKFLQTINIIQYWGLARNKNGEYVESVVEWVEDTNLEIGRKENPMPLKNIPFYPIYYSLNTNNIWGDALSEIIKELQKVKTGAMRAVLDNATQANNGTVAVNLDGIKPTEVMRLKKGARWVMFRGTNSPFVPLGFNPLPQSVLQASAMADKEIDSLTSVTEHSPAAQKVSINNQIQTFSQAKIEDSMNELSVALSSVMRDWIAMISYLYTAEDIQRWTGYDLKDVNLFDFMSLNKISVQVKTEEKKRQQLFNINMLLQQSAAIQGSLPPKAMGMLVSQVYDLLGYHEMAKEIRDTEPGISPQEELAMKLDLAEKQLKLQKMSAETQEIGARAQTHQINAEAKLQDIGIKGEAASYKNIKTMAEAEKIQRDTALKPLEVANKMPTGFKYDSKGEQ